MSSIPIRSLIAVGLTAVVVALLPLPLRSSRVQDRVPQRIEDGRETALHGNVHPLARAENDDGRESPLKVLPRIVMSFQPTAAQQAELDNLLREQQDASSADYHQWLAPEQFADRFGVSEADLARVTDWLESRGFAIVERARSRTYVAFRGSVGQVDSVFRTEIHRYKVDGEEHFANTSEPTVPANLAAIVRAFHGLDDFRPHPHVIVQALFTSSISGNHFLAPDDFATIFNLQPLYKMGLDGTGQKIAIAGQSQINLGDIQTFRSVSGLLPSDPQVILIPGSGTPASTDIVEASLDIEWSGAVARNAQIIFVNSTNAFSSMQYAIDNNVAPVLSVSYGLCERAIPNAQMDAYAASMQQANAQGMTIVVASGDKGAADCTTTTVPTVDFPAAMPYVTAVGGTTLNDGGGTFGTAYWNVTNNNLNGSALSYIPEVAWNDGANAASGGGASFHFPKPSWQAGAGVPNDGVRDVPDIALPASAAQGGYLICAQGSCTNGYRRPDDTLNVIGGTSAGAPAFAGILALINQFIGTSQGNINPRLYRLAAISSDVFHDVTSGTNNGFSTGPGYDQVTGLGSVDAFNLAMEWVPFAVSPNPISFGNRLPNISSTKAVTLRNNFSAVLNVTGVSITGNFGQTNNCVGTLSFGATCTINVTYLPTSLTAQAGTLTITADDSASPHLVPVTGNGSDLTLTLARPDRLIRSEVNPAPVASSAPAPTANVVPVTATEVATPRVATALFAAVVVAPLEIRVAAGKVTVRNPRAESVAVTVEMSGDATQENDCGAELKAKASCEIRIGKGRGELKVISPAGTAKVAISEEPSAFGVGRPPE